jgi:hypothetical protein
MELVTKQEILYLGAKKYRLHGRADASCYLTTQAVRISGLVGSSFFGVFSRFGVTFCFT